eukprot:GILJ01008633.1.p1 GENE.GILJ01008633.1~~GILJ01008633.1.p1  ORF type:complete len:934 (+),score=229.04 GILJ01008633.1:199-3000(+)
MYLRKEVWCGVELGCVVCGVVCCVVMSRLIIKNIPKHLTEQRLREHFESKGQVTDVKIVKTKDGNSRQFGFVGYKTEKDALAAQKYFDNTFLDTSKINVGVAKAIGDSTLPRAWSRHSKGSSAHMRGHPSLYAKEAEEKAEEHAQLKNGKSKKGKGGFQEQLTSIDNDDKIRAFMSVMKPKSNSKFWANDDALAKQSSGTRKEKKKEEGKLVTSSAVKSARAGMADTRTHIQFDDSDDEYQSLPNVSSEGPQADTETDMMEVDEEKKQVVLNEAVSDLDYLKSKVSTFNDNDDFGDDEDEEEEIEDDEEGEEEAEQDTHKQQPSTTSATDAAAGVSVSAGATGKKSTTKSGAVNSDNNKKPSQPSIQESNPAGSTAAATPNAAAEDEGEDEPVAESGRLYVQNLPFSATEEELHAVFKKYGAVAEIHVPMDEMKRARGFAYVLYVMPESAVRALAGLDRSIFQGRPMYIVPAKRKKEIVTVVDKFGKPTSSYKRKQEEKRKKDAALEHNWNSLFIRQDTVAQAMAQKLNVSKSELIDAHADNLAVRMALSEANIIAETKRWLEEQGINIDAFKPSSNEEKIERSKTVIIVKNIPYDTEITEVQDLFARYGALGRTVMPPSKSLVLVEYLESTDAKRGFKSLAYRKFKHVPLFLEWAPNGVFREISELKAAAEKKNNALAGIASTNQIEEEGNVDDMDKASTLFVKNLNFQTTDSQLKSFFASKIGHVRSVNIVKKKDPKNPGKMLSMGYGFVEFENETFAEKAVKTLQSTVLDEHALQLKVSNKRASDNNTTSLKRKSDPSAAAADKATTKIMVRNVAFEATKKEIRELFASYGQIKAVRIPRKFDGTHRGFAFVEFLTKQEAKNAFEALKDNHMYGRHLVLEWAQAEQSLDELRTKTAKQFEAVTEGPPQKKKKFNLMTSADQSFAETFGDI